jgi:predicted TPR repeat methyltransferase
MKPELPSLQSYERVVRACLAAGRRDQAVAAFAQLMHAHPSSTVARALLVEMFGERATCANAACVQVVGRDGSDV